MCEAQKILDGLIKVYNDRNLSLCAKLLYFEGQLRYLPKNSITQSSYDIMTDIVGMTDINLSCAFKELIKKGYLEVSTDEHK